MITYFLFQNKNKYIPQRIVIYIFKFYQTIISRENLVSNLHSYIPQIIQDHIIPNITILPNDLETWEHDNISYIYDSFNNSEFKDTKRSVICKFLKQLFEYKKRENIKLCKKNKLVTKPEYFDTVYNFMIKSLESIEIESKTNTNNSNNKGRNNIYKEAIFHSLQYLTKCIETYVRSNEIEAFIYTYVQPELTSEYGYLREKANELLSNFRGLKYKNKTNLISISTLVCKSLEDTILSVRVKAALCIPILISQKEVKELMIPHITDVLTIYLKILREIDLVELLTGLENIVVVFQDNILNLAIDFACELTNAFIRTLNSLKNDEETNDYENSHMIASAGGILKTLCRLLEISLKKDELYYQIEKVYMYYKTKKLDPIIKWGLSNNDNYNIIDEVIDILSIEVARSPKISELCWSYFPLIINYIVGYQNQIEEFKKKFQSGEFEGPGYEIIQDFIVIINNYIIRYHSYNK